MYVGFEAAGRLTAAVCIAVGSVTPTGVLTSAPPCAAPACAPATAAPDPGSALTRAGTPAVTDPSGATVPAGVTGTSAAAGLGTATTTVTGPTTAPATMRTAPRVAVAPATATVPPTSVPPATVPPTTAPATTPPTATTAPQTPATQPADPVAPPVVDPPGGTASADYQAGYDAGYSAGFAAGRAAAGGGTGGTTGGTRPTVPPPPATGTGTSAATRFGWGTPSRVDEFTGGLGQWGVYDGAGHAGNGRRSPTAVTTQNGVLTISGDANGTTGGMSWGPGTKYGRWEARVRAPAGDPSYHAVALLWPDAENWPVGGEVDFMEMMDASRQVTNMFLHYGASNSQVSGSVRIDATQWHDWAVEWTPDHIAAFVDGQEWWRTSTTAILPPGPMHLTLQLDWFPQGGSARPSAMHVDRVAYYPL